MSSKRVKHGSRILHLKEKSTHCFYCHKSFEEINTKIVVKTIDHFNPLNLGGENRMYNKVICCYRCNGYKSNYSPFEFLNIIDAGLAGTVKVKHRAYYPDSTLFNIKTAILKILSDVAHAKPSPSGYFIINNNYKGYVKEN